MNQNDIFKNLNIGLPEDIANLKAAGFFDEAIRLIDLRLADPYAADEMKDCMRAHKEIMKRLPDDYTLTKEELMEEIRSHIPDFTEEDFQKEEDDRIFKWIFVNGEKKYFCRTYRTMVKTDLEMAKRAGLPGTDADADLLNPIITKCIEEGKASHHVRFTRTLQVKDEVFYPGMFVRVHIPIPANCIQQSKIKIESVSPKGAIIAPEDADARTVCWEETMEENHEFSVTYSYVFTNEYVNAYEESLGCSKEGICTADAAYEPGEQYLCEQAPHIIFTPLIKSLVDKITCGCNAPEVKAKRIYDYLTTNLKYTFMPDYFVMENIADTAARNMRGDCGVMALLYITLCRAAGVGARWQSGLCMEPESFGEHDWTEIYLPEFGWRPVDVSYGVAAHRYGNGARRQFYFGNLEPYRMVANKEFMAPFTPDKQMLRNDPYDNQDGEIETDRKPLKWDEYARRGKIEVL